MLGILITLIVLVSVKVTSRCVFAITAPLIYLLSALPGKAVRAPSFGPSTAELELWSVPCKICLAPAWHSTAQRGTAELKKHAQLQNLCGGSTAQHSMTLHTRMSSCLCTILHQV